MSLHKTIDNNGAQQFCLCDQSMFSKKVLMLGVKGVYVRIFVFDVAIWHCSFEFRVTSLWNDFSNGKGRAKWHHEKELKQSFKAS